MTITKKSVVVRPGIRDIAADRSDIATWGNADNPNPSHLVPAGDKPDGYMTAHSTPKSEYIKNAPPKISYTASPEITYLAQKNRLTKQ